MRTVSNTDNDQVSCCHVPSPGEPLRISRNLKISLALLLFLIAVSFLPSLSPLNASLLGYLRLLAIPLAAGFLLGGAVDYFVPEGFIYRYLGKTGKSSLLYALAGGFLMSSCSHGILAIAIQIYRKGASTPAVITFLLASPWANFPVTILLVSFFGWKGVLFIVTAGFIAILTGLIFEALERGGHVEKNDVTGLGEGYEWEKIKNFSLRESVQGVLRGSLSLSNMVLWWLIIGLIAAVLIDVYVPGEFFMRYLGPDTGGLLLTLVGATVIEVCSEGSSVIAFEIYDKVQAFGNPFVFLMAGVVTDYTEIGLLWTSIGRKTALLLPAVAVPQVLFFGFLYNAIL
ncbi:MAG: permease [Candidatus Dadabacteria bacterium]|nr:permease [Candidatus Dadabacteria bacterium]